MHSVSCEYEWVDAADAALDGGELVLPRDDDQFTVGDVDMGHAAVYRFVLRDETGNARWYVGQSGAIDARFGNYEGGAAREGTDQHVHEALKSHLEKGGSVSVQALVKPCLAVNDGEPARTWKYGHRRILLEAAAIVESLETLGESETLNKPTADMNRMAKIVAQYGATNSE